MYVCMYVCVYVYIYIYIYIYYTQMELTKPSNAQQTLQHLVTTFENPTKNLVPTEK